MRSNRVDFSRTMNRKKIATGSKWEPVVGYSRAVRAGSLIFVAGTTAMGSDGTCPPDAYGQTRRILEVIDSALQQSGGQLSDVVRTRIFVTDISQWEEVGRAHGEIFGSIRPVTTMVQVAKLISPELLVEIEADAVVETHGEGHGA